MALPATIDILERYLFADVSEMAADGVAAPIRERLIRLRDNYTYWLQYPSKKSGDIVQRIEQAYKVSKSTSYEDVRLIKQLLGNLTKTTKDYHRYRFSVMIEETFDMARRIKDARAMASASNYYGKYNQLDKDDQVDKGYDQIVVQPFTPTDDPTVIGLKPIPNVREKIKTTIQKYWHDEIEDVDYEPADFNEDDIFKIPKKIGGEE